MNVMVFKPAVLLTFLLYSAVCAGQANAQTGTATPLHVAVLAPLYVDSVFEEDNFKGGIPLPKYMQPGLEFYNGVMMAVDSLQKEHIPAEVWVFDTRKKQQSTEALLSILDTCNLSLIIASISSAAEQQALSSYAFNKNIPLISATYPNDAGVAGNPFYVIINPTLKTHTEGVYKYVQRNYIGNKVYYVTRNGGMERRIKSYFDGMVAKTAALKYKLLQLPDGFNASNIRQLADTTQPAVFICGSLDDNFSLSLVRALSTISFGGQVTAVGMPTWEGAKGLAAEDCRNVNIVYSTPYNFNRADKVLAGIADAYQAVYNARPGDMVFKGYQAMYHFTHLLVNYNSSGIIANLSNSDYNITGNYDFQPVHLSAASFVPDYLENKKLYFVKMLNGVVKPVN